MDSLPAHKSPEWLSALTSLGDGAEKTFAPGTPASKWMAEAPTLENSCIAADRIASSMAVKVGYLPATAFQGPVDPSRGEADEFLLLIHDHHVGDSLLGTACRATDLGNIMRGFQRFIALAGEHALLMDEIRLEGVRYDEEQVFEFHLSRWVFDTALRQFWLVALTPGGVFVNRCYFGDLGVHRIDGICVTHAGAVTSYTTAVVRCDFCAQSPFHNLGDECSCPPSFRRRIHQTTHPIANWGEFVRRSEEDAWNSKIFDNVSVVDRKDQRSCIPRLVKTRVVETLLTESPKGPRIDKLRCVLLRKLTRKATSLVSSLATTAMMDSSDKSNRSLEMITDSEDKSWHYCDMCSSRYVETPSAFARCPTTLPVPAIPSFHTCSFIRASNLRRHQREIHFKERKFRCPYCPKSFSQKTNCTRHVASVHERRRDYRCGECGLLLASRSNLKRHLLVAHSCEMEAV